MKKELLEWGKALLFAVVVVFVINIFGGTTTVLNTSMFPNLIEGDVLILYKLGDVDRGDIVTFESDLLITEYDLESINPVRRFFIGKNAHKNLIKRVIGMPGDKIDIVNGEVYINDELLDESAYVTSKTTGEVHIDEIPEGKYFLMGDNRLVSKDSRDDEIGLVDEETIIGEAVLRLWPFNRMTTF